MYRLRRKSNDTDGCDNYYSTVRVYISSITGLTIKVTEEEKDEFRSVNPDSNFNNGGIFMCLWNCKQDLYMC